ncbi:MAG: ribonuclease HI family protein [Candidatus Yanofskybacteria bacterium]|nr:ribonuclease HI family protein [Candidatus Yanofskybacteria bacterium]
MEKNRIIIHTDGGSRGNPGPAAIGVVIESDLVGKKEYGEHIGETTNNEAEYRAVIFALKKIKSLIGSDKAKENQVEFMLDSELVVKQLNKEYKLKDKNIQNFFIEIWNLTFDFGEVSFRYVPREKNKEADRIVNQVLNREGNKLL